MGAKYLLMAHWFIGIDSFENPDEDILGQRHGLGSCPLERGLEKLGAGGDMPGTCCPFLPIEFGTCYYKIKGRGLHLTSPLITSIALL